MQALKCDQQTKALWKEVERSFDVCTGEELPSTFCKALEFLLGRVNAMLINVVNARLR